MRYYEDLFKHKILPSMKFIEKVMGCNEYIVGKVNLNLLAFKTIL